MPSFEMHLKISFFKPFNYFSHNNTTHMMNREFGASSLNTEFDEKDEGVLHFKSGRPRVTPVGCVSFPEAVSHIVAEYLSDEIEGYYAEAAFAGVQPITLSISPDGGTNLAHYWPLGLLAAEQQWASMSDTIDHECLIKDIKEYLDLFDGGKLDLCRIRIDILIVKLSITFPDSPNAFDDLRSAMLLLHDHLTSVKHLVFSLSAHLSFCFSFKNASNNRMAVPTPVHPQNVLLQIVDDLHTCWKLGNGFTARELLAFYFKSNIRPISEKHLATFVLWLQDSSHHALLMEYAFSEASDKIMGVSSVTTANAFCCFNQTLSDLSHIINVNTSELDDVYIKHLGDSFQTAFSYRDNRFLRRIDINSGSYRCPLQLPRPSLPLTNTATLSALIEITLVGVKISLNLSDLNNGFFPELTHVSVVEGKITGHLDSYHVPRLKTLRLELGQQYHVDAKTNESVSSYVLSLLRSGRPWQLAATRMPGGWSLASYDEATPNPQDDVKEDLHHTPPSLPLMELLLVSNNRDIVYDWCSRLQGNSYLGAATGEHNDDLWVWAPESVQKITAYGMKLAPCRLCFDQEILGKTRSLTSLKVHNATLALDGAALPFLKSLELDCVKLDLSGAFPQLEVISLLEINLIERWNVNAPLLRSFIWRGRGCGECFFIYPRLLPHLSVLKVASQQMDSDCPPKILLDANDTMEFSRLIELELGEEFTSSPSFHQLRVDRVLRLTIFVDPQQLPRCWLNTEWQSERLTLGIIAPSLDDAPSLETPKIVILPPLPQVKVLTVTTESLPVWLNKEMSNLVECSVKSPEMLGPQLRCPALKRITFSGHLSKSDKERCLDSATYKAIGAQPRVICFQVDGEERMMTWDAAPNGNESLPLGGPLEEGDHSFLSFD